MTNCAADCQKQIKTKKTTNDSSQLQKVVQIVLIPNEVGPWAHES